MATRQIPELPASVGLQDTDLLITRQGATDKNLTGELSKQGHGGIIPWVATFNFLKDGYTTFNGVLYLCLQDNLNQDPEVSPSQWEPQLAFTIATQNEAETGTDNTKGMTPLRAHEAFQQYGLGVTPGTSITDLDAQFESGFFSFTTGATGAPTSFGNVLVIAGPDAQNGCTQITTRQTPAPTTLQTQIRHYDDGAWQPWREFWHNGNLSSGQIFDARVNFVGTGTVSVRSAHNVSSVTDHGTGEYSANFGSAVPTNSTVLLGSSRQAAVSVFSQQGLVALNGTVSNTTNSVRIICSANTWAAGVADHDTVCIGVVGD
jgi:hypothetical protein